MVRQVSRAVALAAAGALLLSGTTFADDVLADGDVVTAGAQTTVDLGTVAPGATITRDVTLRGFGHGDKRDDRTGSGRMGERHGRD